MKRYPLTEIMIAGAFLAACSKSPVKVAGGPDHGPDNAMTRYAENLARAEARAQAAADKANAAIARQDDMTRRAGNQAEDKPQQ